MRAVHNHAWVARTTEALLIQSESGLVEIRVTIDLHDEREGRSLIAHVTTFISHEDAESGVVLTNQ